MRLLARRDRGLFHWNKLTARQDPCYCVEGGQRTLRHEQKTRPMTKAKSAASSHQKPELPGLALLAIVTLGIGSALLAVRSATLRNVEAAKDWVAVACVVEASQFEAIDEGKALRLVYRYLYNGVEYRSDRLDLLPGSMGDDGAWESTLFEENPPGSHTVCYVDPNDPANAVFDREHGAASSRKLLLLAYPFLCISGGFFLAMLRRIGRKPSRPAVKRAARPSPTRQPPGPPPRKVGFWTTMAVLAGPTRNQAVWLFVVGFAYLFVVFEGPAVVADLFGGRDHGHRAAGRVTRVETLPQRELYQPIVKYEFTYSVDGEDRSGESFTRGMRYQQGDRVTVVYDSHTPAQARIANTRPRSFPWWIAAIPLAILGLLAFGTVGMYVDNFRTLLLLKYGMVGQARRVDHTATEVVSAAEDLTSRPQFGFDAEGKTYIAKCGRAEYTNDPPSKVTVVYDPRCPHRNLVFDQLLGRFPAAENGLSLLALCADIVVAPAAIAAILLLFAWL